MQDCEKGSPSFRVAPKIDHVFNSISPPHAAEATSVREFGANLNQSLPFSFQDEDPIKKDVKSTEVIKSTSVKIIFCFFLLVQTLVNFDSGAFPSVLNAICFEFPTLTTSQLGVLGALPYIGLMISAPVVGSILQKTSQHRDFLFFSLICNALSGLLLSFSVPPNKWILFLGRYLLGITQSPIVIYGPVWVDEFAADNRLTLWMGLIQGFSVVGVMTGYLAAGFLSNLGINWRWAMVFEGVLLASVSIMMILFPADQINIKRKPTGVQDSDNKFNEINQAPRINNSNNNQLSGRNNNWLSAHISSSSGIELITTTTNSSCNENISNDEIVVVKPISLETPSADICANALAAQSARKLVPTRTRLSMFFSEQLEFVINSTSPELQNSNGLSGMPMRDVPPLGEAVHSAFQLMPGFLRAFEVRDGHQDSRCLGEIFAKDYESIYKKTSATGIGPPRMSSTCRAPTLWTSHDCHRHLLSSDKTSSSAQTGSSADSNNCINFFQGDTGTEIYPYINSRSLDSQPDNFFLEGQLVRHVPIPVIRESSSSAVSCSSSSVGYMSSSRSSENCTRLRKVMNLAPAGMLLESLDLLSQMDQECFLRSEASIAIDRSIALQTSRTEANKESVVSVQQPMKHFSLWHNSTVTNAKTLLQNPIYVMTVVSISALFFVATGIQYWSTHYFEKVMQVKSSVVLISFATTAATAPTLGVLSGGVMIDYIGGYKSKTGTFNTLACCTIWAVLSCAFGIAYIYLVSDCFPLAISLIWLVLFFGGAILPAGTGILLASVDPNLRAFTSGFSMLIYNVFGYTLGSYLPGLVMQLCGVRAGMKVVFLWSLVGVAGAASAMLFALYAKLQPDDVRRSLVISKPKKNFTTK